MRNPLDCNDDLKTVTIVIQLQDIWLPSNITYLPFLCTEADEKMKKTFQKSYTAGIPVVNLSQASINVTLVVE